MSPSIAPLCTCRSRSAKASDRLWRWREQSGTPCSGTPQVRFRSRSDPLSSGYFDPLRIHPAVVAGKQTCDHRSDVVRHPDPAKRRHVGEQAIDLRVVAHATAAEVRLDCARRHRVDGNTALAQFLRHITGEHFDCSFHRCVHAVTGKADPGKTGGQIDDASTVGDQRQQGLGQEKHALEVNVDEAVELRFRGLVDQGVFAVAGIVDEVIDVIARPAILELAAQLSDEGRDVIELAGIKLKGNRLAAKRPDLLDDSLGLVPATAIGQDDISSAPCNAEGSVSAKSSIPASDESDDIHVQAPVVEMWMSLNLAVPRPVPVARKSEIFANSSGSAAARRRTRYTRPMDKLLEAVSRYTEAHSNREGVALTPIAGLTTVRATFPSGLVHAISRPLICLILQGSKHVSMGQQSFVLNAGDSMLITADVPIVSQITCASMAKPYLALVLELDTAIIADLSVQIADASPGPGLPIRLTSTDAEVADAALRLVRLLDRPSAIPVLQSQLVREMHYWLLEGRHGESIRGLGAKNGHAQRVARAVALLRAEFAQTLRTERLAAAAGMSLSSFHQHFRAATSLSPLQFQKQLRLIEARRLMRSEGASASSAAFAVGYESVSQFTRDYGRMFGAPPVRDARMAKDERTAVI